MAEININAKIEEALIKIKPAKQSGQFGVYEKYIDDYIIATIKTYPEVDLGFVDRLSGVIIENKNRRQAKSRNVAESVRGDNLFIGKNAEKGFKIYDRVRLFPKSYDSKELGYEDANVLIPKKIKPYVKLKKGKVEFDYEKISMQEAQLVVDNLKADHLDKLSEENYAALFEYLENSLKREQESDFSNLFENLEKVLDEGQLDSGDKKIVKNKGMMQILFHELNHAVSLKQFIPANNEGKQIGNTFVENSSQIDGDRFYNAYHGGSLLFDFDRQEKENNKTKITFFGPLYMHEGQTELLSNEQMETLYPGEFNYHTVKYAYFPMALYAKAINGLCGDVFKKAYYGGCKELEKQPDINLYNNIMHGATEVARIYGQLDKGLVAEECEDRVFEDLLKRAVETQNVLLGSIMFEAKNQLLDEETTNQMFDLLASMVDERVWDGTLCQFSDEKIDEYRNRFYPILTECFNSEMDLYFEAQNEPNFEKFIVNRVGYAMKHSNNLVGEAEEKIKEREQAKKENEKSTTIKEEQNMQGNSEQNNQERSM